MVNLYILIVRGFVCRFIEDFGLILIVIREVFLKVINYEFSGGGNFCMIGYIILR